MPDQLLSAKADLMPRVEGELSSVLGVLATGRNQGKLEGFTINMTSLDDIFLEVNNFTLFDFVQMFMMEVTMHCNDKSVTRKKREK